MVTQRSALLALFLLGCDPNPEADASYEAQLIKVMRACGTDCVLYAELTHIDRAQRPKARKGTNGQVAPVDVLRAPWRWGRHGRTSPGP
ncbi:MAG: hypothetical protein EA397_00715 [Deltaproteobacteria bacterium]|nr:MAG: hypothetical protein EA397_00715 [Deltaproteobacteria bacterium]